MTVAAAFHGALQSDISLRRTVLEESSLPLRGQVFQVVFIMRVLGAVTGSWCGQDRDHENIFLCKLCKLRHIQWFADSVLGTPRASQLHLSSLLSDPSCKRAVRIPCCWICWSLQITFLCGLCWFYVVNLVTHFYLIWLFLFFALHVVCYSRTNTQTACPWRPVPCCSSPKSLQIFAPHQPLSPKTWAVTRGGAAEGRGGRPAGVKLAHGSRCSWLGEFSKGLPCLQSSRRKGTWLWGCMCQCTCLRGFVVRPGVGGGGGGLQLVSVCV